MHVPLLAALRAAAAAALLKQQNKSNCRAERDSAAPGLCINVINEVLLFQLRLKCFFAGLGSMMIEMN